MLEKVIQRCDILILNDQEVRELSGKPNLLKAARMISENGPKTIIIKKGEHGAMLYHEDKYFFAPAYPLEKVIDPTGAGDSFAGGFVGYLATHDKVSDTVLKKAVIYGSAIASFNCEDFSLNRLISLKKDDLEKRVKAFRDLTLF